MNDDKPIQEFAVPSGPEIEERGIDLSFTTDLITAGASVVSAGAAIYAASQSGQSHEPPPPEPPEIELPPGVDRD
jgi:hypothetical protein